MTFGYGKFNTEKLIYMRSKYAFYPVKSFLLVFVKLWLNYIWCLLVVIVIVIVNDTLLSRLSLFRKLLIITEMTVASPQKSTQALLEMQLGYDAGILHRI